MSVHKLATGPWSCSDLDAIAKFLGAGNDTNLGGKNRYHCDYVIYTDGIYYYAEYGGSGGGLAFGGPSDEGLATGNDFIEVFNGCHNALPNGGKIIIRHGDYSTDSTLTVTQANLTVEFARGSTVIPNAGINPVIAIGDDSALLRRVKVMNPCIDGTNLIANTTYYRLLGTQFCELWNPRVTNQNFIQEGILIQGGASYGSYYNIIWMPMVSSRVNGGAGIRLNSNVATFSNNNIIIGGNISSEGYAGTIGLDVGNSGTATDNFFYGIDLSQPADGWEIRDNSRRNRYQVRLESLARILVDTSATDTMILVPLRDVELHVRGTYPIVLSNEYAAKWGHFDLGNTWFHDPFLGANFKAEWNNADVGGTSALVGGELQQSTGGVLGQLCQLDWNGQRGIPSRTNESKNRITARVELQDLTQMTAYFGFWRDATHYILAYYDSLGAAANWFLRTDDGAGPTSVDSGILGDTNVHEFMIDQKYAATVDLYIDGVQVATSTTNLMSGNSEIILYIETKENVDKQIVYDRFSVGSRYPQLT